MTTSRRNFLKLAAASTAGAYLPVGARVSAAETLQQKLAADSLRPQFHLLPAKNWMNDPNGPIYWKNHYHLFFQYNPGAAVWGDMHWAHAISEDMIHWRHLPIALAPTPGGDDSEGCFTGSAVDDRGTATFLYTGVKTVAPQLATLRDGHSNFREVQCLATSDDPQLLTWKKYPQPVIQPPDDPTLAGFRDPFLLRQDNDWLLGVAGGHFKTGGCVLLYRSKDLRRWEAAGQLASGHWTEKPNTNPVDSGEMWECPDFFRLGKKHVLLYSTRGQVFWESGDFDAKELKFHSERSGILDYGAYYAQKTQLDAKGNRILWGWVPEKRPDSELIAAGWAGCMALPRVLSLDANGNLEMRIASAAHSLRGKAQSIPGRGTSAHDRANALHAISLKNLSAELIWTVFVPDRVVGEVRPTEFSLDDNLGPWWSMRVEHRNGNHFTVNGQRFDLHNGPGDTEIGGPHTFHLFIDGSVAELIVRHRQALTTRIYRPPQGPLSIRLTAESLASILDLTAWQLKPISPNRLTT
jgi:beta-fructofuranosidase